MSSATPKGPAPLIVVFQRGGADGLSLIAPAADPAYRRARPTLAVPESGTTELDHGLVLHPKAANLAKAWAARQLAVVPACAIAGQSRSHFDAQFLAETASAPADPQPTGWIARHLAATASPREPRPLRGLCLGTVGIPAILRGTSDAIGTPTLDALGLGLTRQQRAESSAARRSPTPPADALRALWNSAPATHPFAAAGVGAFAALAAAPKLNGAAVHGSAGAGSTDAGENTALLRQAAAALGAGAGVEVVVVNSGHWDDHANLGPLDGAFAKRISDLDAGIGVVRAARPDAHVLVLSEFGRRVQENASGGADHGRGGVVMLIGPRVRGGVHGEWPGLTQLDEGDVRAANDQRAVLYNVAATLLDADTERVFPDYKPSRPLALVDA